jgi:cytochrome P450
MTDLYYDPMDAGLDPTVHDVWRRMREEAPVYWNDRYQFFALSRFDDVWNGYHDTATYSSAYGTVLGAMGEPLPMPMVIFMDPPEHDWMRKLVSRAFTPRRIADLEAHIAALTDQYLDAFVGSDGFDYVTDFGALLPPMVIGHMLGVPKADRDKVRVWFDETLHREGGDPMPSASAQAAMMEMWEYAQRLIEDRRHHPGDDMITVLMEGEVDDGTGPRRLSDLEVVSFLMLLAGAGVETVARFLSWAAVTFAANPDQRALLVDDPALIPNAVEELLRYEAPSPVNGRVTLQPVTLHGVEIPERSHVLLLNGSANRDPREFDEPDRFDVRRTFKRHTTFGYGAHFCLGAALARMEARIALEGTLKRFPQWDVDPAECVRVSTSTVRGYSSVPIHLR